jgi:diaminopimelate decarboxylase
MKQIKDLGIKLSGIHFHCGSGKDGSSGFKKGIEQARQCMRIGREYGHPMDILDIGGGFPAGELPESTIEAVKQTENDPLGYRVMAEPGRHLCANSCYILARVIGVRYKGG